MMHKLCQTVTRTKYVKYFRLPMIIRSSRNNLT